MNKVIDQYNNRNTNTTEECKKCKETTEEYDSLICEYKRVEQYMINQETQIEEIRNNNYHIILMNYLEVNERKAQRKAQINEYNRLVDNFNTLHNKAATHVRTLLASLDNANERCNKKAQEYDNIVKHYRELQEKYTSEMREWEYKEFHRN